MAVVKKKIGNEIKEFPYNPYGLDENGHYKILPLFQRETITLKPDGYDNNPTDFKYSCSSTVASLIDEGKTAIYTDDSETHSTLWKTVRDGLMASNKNDNLYLGYKDDTIGADLGDDFIEIDNHSISVDGDLTTSSPEGGVDVFMVRCGNAYVAGNGNSDHYFINISQKCRDKGYTKSIKINEISYNDDANKLHLCEFSFHSNVGNNILDILSNSGIRVGLLAHNAGLGLYFRESLPHEKPDIVISHYCDNYGETSVNPPIAAIIDKDGMELSLQGLNCTTIAEYVATHSIANNEPTVDDSTTNKSIHNNPLSNIIDYVVHTNLFSNLMHLVSNISEHLGTNHEEL